MNASPFSRSRAMMAAVVAAIGKYGRDALGQFKVAQEVNGSFGTYKSHGHGQGLSGNKHSARSVAQDKRDAVKRRNKGKH